MCFPSQHSPLQVWFSFKCLKRALRSFSSLFAAIVRAYLSITLSIPWQSSGFNAWLACPACLRRILHNIEQYHCKSYRIPLALSFKSPCAWALIPSIHCRSTLWRMSHQLWLGPGQVLGLLDPHLESLFLDRVAHIATILVFAESLTACCTPAYTVAHWLATHSTCYLLKKGACIVLLFSCRDLVQGWSV